MRSFTDRVVYALEGCRRFIAEVEGLLVDVIAATSPWLAPLIPAYMAWKSMVDSLRFPDWVAFGGAAVVELLGLSAVTTTFQFWDYNDARRKSDQRAPAVVAGVTAIFYLAVVMTVNVILDNEPTMNKIAKALLSSLSVCAAVVLALRSSHARRMETIRQEKIERREERLFMRTHGQSDKPDTDRTLTGQSDWRELPAEDRALIQNMTTADIVAKYGCSDRVARRWKNYSFAQNNGHNQETVQ